MHGKRKRVGLSDVVMIGAVGSMATADYLDSGMSLAKCLAWAVVWALVLWVVFLDPGQKRS